MINSCLRTLKFYFSSCTSVGPFWSFNYQDRNDRFPTLSYASNNEIPIFLKVPLSCVPPPSALLKETILYSKKHGTEWLIYCLVSSCKNNCKIYRNYIHVSSENSSPSINRLPRIIASPSPLLSSYLFLLSPPCQLLLESDPVLKLISEDSSHGN